MKTSLCSVVTYSCHIHSCQGWDVNVTNREGVTPLHATIGQGHEDIATLLVTEGANIMTKDKKGATPLHYAVR